MNSKYLYTYRCKMFKLRPKSSIYTLWSASRFHTTAFKLEAGPLMYEKDPAPVFTRKDVQKLLQSITRLDLDKIFRKRTVKDNTVEYKFMTDDELRQEILHSIQKAKEMLQMPPVVNIMQDKPRLFSKDGALKQFSDTKMVITDVTYGVRDNKRTIVERLPDGTLQEASFETKKRLNQLYFPLKGRTVRCPKMFDPPNLLKILEAGNYEFVLNRACIQFEPYEEQYHSVTSTVYQHVNENKAFDALRSTRHFGPMCFFLTWNRLIDDLLLDMVKHDYLRNGVELIVLYCLMHATELKGFEEMKQHIFTLETPVLETSEKTQDDFRLDDKYLSFIEQFIAEHSIKKIQLNLAVAAYREEVGERQKMMKEVRELHSNS